MAQSHAPLNQIWIAYNHLPGGHIVVMHFEDIARQMRQGEQTKTVKITAKEQVDNFKKSPQVALNVGGKIVRNEVLLYQGPALEGDPQAADKVIAYADSKGMKAIVPLNAHVAESGPDSRVSRLETDVANLKTGQHEILALLNKIVPAGAKT